MAETKNRPIMENLMNILKQGNYSCVISNGETRTYQQAGVRDLYELINQEPAFLKNAMVADKVVGKAAASLMIQGGVKEVFADMISSPAILMLKENGIKVRYNTEVPNILNKPQTGLCPLETLCMDTDNPQEILIIIQNFIQK